MFSSGSPEAASKKGCVKIATKVATEKKSKGYVQMTQ